MFVMWVLVATDVAPTGGVFFTVRPAIARKAKPKVSAFTSAKIGEILKLQQQGRQLRRFRPKVVT